MNEKWLKASIIGSVWASSEIVLGSFLHNLRVPFSGSLLTAIGVVLLISVSYIWRERGIFWRAGLICALMKTMSPSAVIFGPMIAIFVEGVLLEFAVRLLGRNYAGFITGAVLAASWSFVQKILNFLIFYGFNIVELYKSIMQYAEKQLNIAFDTLWLPVFLLFAVYVAIGFISAITGIRTGKKLKSRPIEYKPLRHNNIVFRQKNKSDNEFRFSIIWLLGSFFFMVIALTLISYTQWYIWSTFVVLLSLIWVNRYKRAMRQIMRPRFYIFFVLITMLTAFAFSSFPTQSMSWQQAMIIGVQMNFRATVLILGFTVLGTELYNPLIRSFLGRSVFRELPVALELSAQSLPGVIAGIPGVKSILKNPVSVVYQLVAYSELRLKHIQNNHQKKRKIYMLTGEKNSGKTTMTNNIVTELSKNNIDCGGVISKKVFENNTDMGYDVVDLTNGKSEILMRKSNERSANRIGRFILSEEGFKKGKELLTNDNNTKKQLIFVDETGQLELEGKGWYEAVNKLLENSDASLFIVARNGYAAQLAMRWKIDYYVLFDAKKTNTPDVVEHILSDYV